MCQVLLDDRSVQIARSVTNDMSPTNKKPANL